jgi:acyl-CoA synthetase
VAPIKAERDWQLRAVPDELVREYKAKGWWTDETVGQVVERGLGGMSDVAFTVRSAAHPWHGTLGEVDDMARRLAASLRDRGVGPGDVVVLQLPNWVEAGVAYWAAAYLGAVVVPIVHFYGPKEVRYILDTVDPDVVVTPAAFGSADHLAMYDDLLRDNDRATWLVVGEVESLPERAHRFDAFLTGSPIEGPLPADPDAPAVIAFTSGTTRDPKGVIHTHRTILCETRQLDDMFPAGGPPQITGSPVGHFIGMVNAFLVPLLRDRPVHLLDVWNPAEVLRLMREEGLGVAGGATYFLTSLLDHPDFDPEVHLPKIPFAGLGGSPVPVAVTERATRMGIKIFRSYGSSEHPSITGCHLDDPEVHRLTTDGHPLEGVEIRLDPETGEIHSRGPDCFLGYTDPKLTASVFDADGWYRTGDVGVLNDGGYLAITDRISDIIIRGGENISAAEVEEVLITMPGIAEVSVVAAPDEKFGEHAAAFVRLLPGAAEPTLDDVREHMAAAGIAKQKWPEAIRVVDELPRTASGKVQKFRLRQRLKEESLTSHR